MRTDTPLDVTMTDTGRGTAGSCEACATDSDCLPDHYCAPLTAGGRACLRSCVIDLADCPSRFECVANFTTSIPEPVCAPVGDRCCVDDDGDVHGTGIGCLGTDCDETNPDVNSSGMEECNGVDDDCDTMTDNGDPSILCPRGTHVAATSCTGAICEIDMCEPGFGDCNMSAADGCETSTNTITSCGSCGNVCALPHVLLHGCASGTCTISTCEDGWGDCNGNPGDGCETSLTSTSHCGGCGVLCGLANADATCASGTCEIADCSPNWGDCDGRDNNGCETALVTNANCGTCGTVCAPTSGSGDCSTGTCRVSTCMPGFSDCNSSTTDGCETNIRTLTNCMGCGVTCEFPNGSASCSSGACTLVGCDMGFGNCDGLAGNGCETRTNTATNCGVCGGTCAPAHATGSCGTGACEIITCDPGWADCNGNVVDGCETDTRTLTNCGSCGATCSRPFATADCSTGTCMIGSCTAGRDDCDSVDTNGCETSIRTVTDCGACGDACVRPNSTETCSSGTCAISSCDPGFGNCNMADVDGCETSLNSLAHCGGCGVTCARNNAAATCGTGMCRVDFCNPGYGNCDTVDSNGCETSLTSNAHCGGCGVVCSGANAVTSCGSGTCMITSCSPGYGDCNGLASDGCEVRLNTNSNCGGCGVSCSPANATGMCSVAGTCQIASCNAGFSDCDGNPMNGCETNIRTTSNCNGCGVLCSGSNATMTCSTGSCAISSCNASYFDSDGAAGNGCECMDDTMPAMCAAATNLGDVAPGMTVTRNGRVPSLGASDWYEVTFMAVSGQPQLDFTVSDGVRFEIRLDMCSAMTATCGATTATDLTGWSFIDNVSVPGTGFTTRDVAWPSHLYIRVYRTAGSTACGDYTLRIRH